MVRRATVRGARHNTIYLATLPRTPARPNSLLRSAAYSEQEQNNDPAHITSSKLWQESNLPQDLSPLPPDRLIAFPHASLVGYWPCRPLGRHDSLTYIRPSVNCFRKPLFFLTIIVIRCLGWPNHTISTITVLVTANRDRSSNQDNFMNMLTYMSVPGLEPGP